MRSALKQFFDVNFFFSNVLVPLIGLVLYCSTLAYFLSRFQLQGVNYFFVSKLQKYLFFIIAGALLAFFILLKSNWGGKLAFRNSDEKFYPGDLFLLLIPLTPIVQYILKNQDVLSFAESLYVLISFVLFAGLYVFAVPALLGFMLPSRTLMIMGLAFVFTIISMSSISDYYNWFESGALRKQLMFLGGAFLVVWLLYNLNQRKVLYFFIAANFIINSSTVLVSEVRSRTAPSVPIETNKLLSLVGERTPAVTPNIYLLLYDAYVPNETMLAHGIDNSAQEDFLREQGFTLYPHTYSIGASTLVTMSRVLNASTEYYGDIRTAVSGSGVVHKLVKNLGYETYGLFPNGFMFSGVRESYDYATPERSTPPSIQLMKAIFLGEFRFDIETVGFDEQTRSQFLETKHGVFENASGKRVFVYMHSDLPAHSQTAGACLPNETALFEQRLALANEEMRQDVDMLIANDPGAILIVAGDHGPYLTKNCYTTTGIYDISEISRLDIQDRHGTFLAIRWPAGDFENYDDITVLQDVFPAVFAYLYEDPTILESKVDPIIPVPNGISGASVNNGIIQGGINDGEPLFLSGK